MIGWAEAEPHAHSILNTSSDPWLSTNAEILLYSKNDARYWVRYVCDWREYSYVTPYVCDWSLKSLKSHHKLKISLRQGDFRIKFNCSVLDYTLIWCNSMYYIYWINFSFKKRDPCKTAKKIIFGLLGKMNDV